MKKSDDEDIKKLGKLTKLIKKLRAPGGCPWDQQQKEEDLGKYILEEAYEVTDSLGNPDARALKEELGDLLFQILFLTEICAESGLFSLGDVMDGINQKMIRRHPHVFGDIKVDSVQDVKNNWQKIKNEERQEKKNGKDLFASIPRSLPALKRAQKITSIASTAGFDWKDTRGVLEKLKEELQEFENALKSQNNIAMEEELGDLLFTIVNISRFLHIDSETALSKTTEKFLRRFARVTKQLSSLGIPLEKATLEQMDELWNAAKTEELT
jgi:tetrapyrrole methylase family protein/MazG family protein